MLRRLVLFLLIACLALPATAAPMAGAPQGARMAATPCHGDAPLPDQAPQPMAKHQCIGCVPPVTQSTDFAAPTELRGIIGIVPLRQRLKGLTDHPATPPPRA
jgi:hypothetical protein